MLALLATLVFFFCWAPSGRAQQGDNSQPSATVPSGWSVQKINEAEISQQVPYDEYIVGEGDVLRIDVWKEKDVSQPSVLVQRDGMISLPLLGSVKVSGMTLTQIRDMLTVKLARYLSKPEVTVAVSQVRSKPVYVTGEVRSPGIYQLTRPTSVMQLIIQAGGLTPYAHRRSVSVLRPVNDKMQKFRVNYKEVLKGNNSEENILLQPGDTVVIP
jgi:polysaccharide export outer membrane protein